MLADMNIDELAKTIQRRRLDKGWSVEEAARRAGINRVTYKRLEEGLPVQDVKRRAVENLFGMGEEQPNDFDGAGAAEIIERDLNPDLAEFTDHELFEELERRLLLLAARAQVSGAKLLTVTVEQDGQRSIVSHTRKGA